MTVTIEDIKQAAKRIAPYIHQTPVMTCAALNDITQAQLFFKCENFQRAGAFKYRGACNAIFLLSDEEAKHGVTTHSSGNHAGAIARAAKTRGIPAYIVMPNNTVRVKKEAVAGYGAQITFCEPTQAAREAATAEIVKKTGAKFIHGYNNEQVIAGQGTVGLEFLAQCKDLDILIVPVGGGGLISGIATAAKAIAPNIKVIGAEPLNANDASESFHQKKLIPIPDKETICDGLRTALGPIPFSIMIEKVDDILTASENSIIKAMQLIWERMKILVEPSSAITLAVMLEYPEQFRGKKIGLILSGGNVDIKALASLLS